MTDADVYAYDIAEFYAALARDTVDDLLVDRDAYIARVAAITKERTFRFVFSYQSSGVGVQLSGCGARTYQRTNLVADVGRYSPTHAHRFQLGRDLDNNHDYVSISTSLSMSEYLSTEESMRRSRPLSS